MYQSYSKPKVGHFRHGVVIIVMQMSCFFTLLIS